MNGGTRTVTTFLLLAFVVWLLGKDVYTKEHDTKGTKTTGEFFIPYIGWAVVAIVLIAGTDFEPTSAVSSGFAALILFSVLLIYGPTVVDKINFNLPAIDQYPTWSNAQ